ncbi:hypothetical protein [Pusillimonas sp. ANT_WB101]|uniref:hypothetical protein n=1 Tax=Pusillimonas sp. ANT_WB101 TaxID=2597356 RepID=UPI0011ED28C5|nr:hypothetical protein [Pusillimonas sp. ANT_WB101]KAA0911850.1 hypothetical protein FQ179_08695 [Pusillimonas sp. ANT_WB101]
MNDLLLSVLLTTFAVLAGGAMFLVALLAIADFELPKIIGWMHRTKCRLSFDCADRCEEACKVA